MNTKIAWESPWSSFSIMKSMVKHSWADFTIEKTLVFQNTPDSKAESVTWKGKLWILFFCNVWLGLLVVFTPQFNNKCRKLYRNLRRSFGKRDQDDYQTSSSFAWQCTTSQCCLNYLLTSLGWEILPHPPHSSDLHRQTSIYSQRWKSTSEVSTSTPIKMFKMKSRQSYLPRTYLFPRTRSVDI